MDTFVKTCATVTAIGLVVAIISAILYFMRLPIFDAISLAWVFLYGLLFAGLAVLAITVSQIWGNG
jgi:uncharacterized membrane-anchored protein YitT (DUF2179 family)